MTLKRRLSGARHRNAALTGVASVSADRALVFGRDVDLDTPEFEELGAIASTLVACRSRRGGGGVKGGASRRHGLLNEDELRSLEELHGEGITAVQVIDIFTSRNVRFSEATFRKYVQQGLLPRSRRVGRKGKHRGSLGVYPAKIVRRINAIKQLMEEGYTIDEIHGQFLRFTDVLETIEENLSEFFSRLDEEASSERFDAKTKRGLTRKLSDARSIADELIGRLASLAQSVVQERGDRFRGSGAAGSAEELL